MLVGSKISCFISYKHVIGSSWALCGVMILLIIINCGIINSIEITSHQYTICFVGININYEKSGNIIHKIKNSKQTIHSKK